MNEPAYEPTDEDMTAFAGLCQAIGFVVLHWALIEQQLDNWVDVAFRNCGGRVLREGQGMPRQLKAKSRFVRLCFEKVAPLTEFRDEGVALASRIDTASDRRHELIHGALAELKPMNGIFKFKRIRYKEATRRISEFEVAPIYFRDFSSTLTDLLVDALAFSQKLATKFPAQ